MTLFSKAHSDAASGKSMACAQLTTHSTLLLNLRPPRNNPGHLTHAASSPMKPISWLCRTVDAASTSVSFLAPNPLLSRPTSAPVIEAIFENRTLTAGIAVVLVIILSIRYIRSPWRKLPPSPKRLPILGNVLQLRNKNWLLSKDCKERFGELIDHYDPLPMIIDVKPRKHGVFFFFFFAGEVVYLDGAGQPILLCNSLKSAFELLERRSGNYSDRPRFVMAHEILGGGILFTLMNYSDPRCRRMRRAAHEALTKRAVQDYQPIQTKEATILVSSLLRPSSDLNHDRHFKRVAASTIMSIVYDYQTIMSEHDHVLEGIERCLNRIVHASTMGSYFVDIFPWMKHIPERSCLCLSFSSFMLKVDRITEQIRKMETGGPESI